MSRQYAKIGVGVGWKPRDDEAREKAEGDSNEELRGAQEEEGLRGPASVFWHWVFGGVASLYTKYSSRGRNEKNF